MFRPFHPARWLGIVLAFVLLVLATNSLSAQSATTRFYYYQNTRIPLNVNSMVIAVQFNASVSAQSSKSIADALGDVDNFDSSVPPPVGGMYWMTLKPGHEPLAALGRFRSNPNVEFASPVYTIGAVQLAETDEFLARFSQNLSVADIARFNTAHQVSISRALANSNRVFVLKPNAGSPLAARELANVYAESHNVEFAEPNFVLRQGQPVSAPQLASESPELTPNDTSFGLQWSLKNTRQFQGAQQGADIKAVNAWNVTQGASSIRVAVIDEGVYASHPELTGKVLTGYNALNGGSDTTPKVGDHHGTAVAGVIAAQTNNAAGMAGVCWFCQILPVKVAETDSHGDWVTTTAILASGIDWAWQNGADILNNSWTMNAPSDSVQLAIINARFSGRSGKGSTIVFASGNEDSNVVSFPASLNSYVIAVGASNWCDQRKTPTNDLCNNNEIWGSNYGSALDLVAPGQAIYTTCNGGQCTNGAFTYLSGTSLSTPLVSGTAALLYSLNPNLTPDQVQQVLQTGAKDIGAAGRDDETGYGRLDAYQAIAAMYNTSIMIANKKKLVKPGDLVTYTLEYANTGISAMGNTQIFATLAANTTYDSSNPAFTFVSGTTYRLDLGTVPGNTSGSAKFRVQIQPAAAGQSVTFQANITGAFPERTTSDNSATDTALGVQRQVFLPLLQYQAQ